MISFLAVAALTFAAIVPVELPDKTFVATLVLTTRYRPVPIYVGVLAAFFVQCLVAVLAGTLIGRLPRQPVEFVAAALFAVGALVLLRGARRDGSANPETQDAYAGRGAAGARQGWRAAVASFVVLFTAEWGDLSQLLTAGLVASGRPVLPVFIGSWVGLAVVSGAAILLGRWLVKRIRLAMVRYAAAAVCGLLAALTLIEALAG